MSIKSIGQPPTISQRLPRLFMSIWSDEAVGMEWAYTGASLTSQQFPAANLAVFVPFGLAVPRVVTKLWWLNGTIVGGNLDCGIYKPDGTRIISSTPQAQSGTSTIQTYDIADTLLSPGRYYMALASDTANGAVQTVIASRPNATVAGPHRIIGLYQMGSLTGATLPNPATFAVWTQTRTPAFGLAFRTLT